MGMTLTPPATGLARALALALTLVLSILPVGCAQLPGSAAQQTPQRAPRASIVAFTFSGRIAVQQDGRNHVSNINWQHAAARDEILLTSPLGQGLAELTRDSAGAHLKLADRREFAAADWEGLAAQVFGMPLPLSALPRWLVGDIPAGAQSIALDETGRPRQVLIDGWRIGYLDYESASANALPTLIELQRGDIEMRLKVNEWIDDGQLPQ